MAISKAKCISSLNQIKIAKIGFLPALILIIAALLAIPLLTTFVSVVWSADKIENYPSQTQDFLKSDLHAKGGKYMGKTQGDFSNHRIICTYLEGGTKTKDWNGNWSGNQNDLNCTTMVGSRKIDFPLDFSHFIKLISGIGKERKDMRVSIDVPQGVPVPVAEKIENGTSTTAVQVRSPDTIPKPTQEALLNGRISNKSYSKNTRRVGAPSSPEDFEFIFRAMAAIQSKPKATNNNIVSHFTAPRILPLPNQAVPHRRRHGNKRLRFGK